MVHSIIDSQSHLYTGKKKKKTHCAHLEISIFSQLETVLFVFFSMNTETLDCLENLFDVCGL